MERQLGGRKKAFKGQFLGVHTELHGVECSDIAAHSLHDKCGHFVADIAKFCLWPTVMVDGANEGLTHRQP